jgi:hypothetical protein
MECRVVQGPLAKGKNFSTDSRDDKGDEACDKSRE